MACVSRRIARLLRVAQFPNRIVTWLRSWSQWMAMHTRGAVRLVHEHIHHAIAAGVFNGTAVVLGWVAVSSVRRECRCRFVVLQLPLLPSAFALAVNRKETPRADVADQQFCCVRQGTRA